MKYISHIHFTSHFSNNQYIFFHLAIQICQILLFYLIHNLLYIVFHPSILIFLYHSFNYLIITLNNIFHQVNDKLHILQFHFIWNNLHIQNHQQIIISLNRLFFLKHNFLHILHHQVRSLYLFNLIYHPFSYFNVLLLIKNCLPFIFSSIRMLIYALTISFVISSFSLINIAICMQ